MKIGQDYVHLAYVGSSLFAMFSSVSDLFIPAIFLFAIYCPGSAFSQEIVFLISRHKKTNFFSFFCIRLNINGPSISSLLSGSIPLWETEERCATGGQTQVMLLLFTM